MMEIFDWFTAEPAMWATVAKWACVPAVAGVGGVIVRLMVAAQRTDMASKGRAFAMAGAVSYPRPESARKPARKPSRKPAMVPAVKASDELDNVVPLLPRAEREALRAGGWF